MSATNKPHLKNLAPALLSCIMLAAAVFLGFQVMTAQDTNPAPTATEAQLLNPEPFGPGTDAQPLSDTPGVAPNPQTAAPAPTGPDQLVAPDVGLSIQLVTGGRGPDGDMALPEPDLAAVYTDSAALDALAGSTVIAGHVNYRDAAWAPMSAIAKLKAGNRILISDHTGTIRTYTVTALQLYPQQGLPAELFTRTGPRTVHLVTCGGPIETVNGQPAFTHNTVITAVPAEGQS